MGSRGPGRPAQTDAEAAALAVHVINVAVAVHNQQWKRLKTMGYTETEARRLIGKRYRGRVGAFIGDTLSTLQPAINRSGRAVQLVLEHGFATAQAARMVGVDRRNLQRALKKGRVDADAKSARLAALQFFATEHHSSD